MAYPVWYTSKKLPEATIGVPYSTPLYISDPDNTSIEVVDNIPNHYLPQGLFVIPPNTPANIATGQIANNTSYYVIAGTPTSATFSEHSDTVRFVLRAKNTDIVDCTFSIVLHYHEQYPQWLDYSTLDVLGAGITADEFSETTIPYIAAGTNLEYTTNNLPSGLFVDSTGTVRGTLPHVLDASFYIFTVTITNPAVSNEFSILNNKRYIPSGDLIPMTSSSDAESSIGSYSSAGDTFKSSTSQLSSDISLSSSVRNMSSAAVTISTSTYRDEWESFNPTAVRPVWFDIEPSAFIGMSVNDVFYMSMSVYPTALNNKSLYYIGEMDAVNNRISLSYTKNNSLPVEFTPIDNQPITFIKYIDKLEKRFSITVSLISSSDPYWITPSDLGSFIEKSNIAFYVQIDDRDNDGIGFYITTSSVVPGDLTIDSATGLLRGTMPDVIIPTDYVFEVGASDGIDINILREFKLRVDPETPMNFVWDTSDDLGMYYENTNSTIQLAIASVQPNGDLVDIGDVDIRINVIAGSLPPGLIINNDSMTIEGIFPRTLTTTEWLFTLGASLVYNGTSVDLPDMQKIFKITVENVFVNDICTASAEYSFDRSIRSTMSAEIIRLIDRDRIYKSTSPAFGLQSTLRFPLSVGLKITNKSLFASKLFDSKDTNQSSILSFEINGTPIVMPSWTLASLVDYINASNTDTTASISEEIIIIDSKSVTKYKLIIWSDSAFVLSGASELGHATTTETILPSPQGMLNYLATLGGYNVTGDNNILRYKNIKWSDLEQFNVKVGMPAIAEGIYAGEHIYDVIYLPIDDTFRRKTFDESIGQYTVDRFDSVGNMQYITDERIAKGDIPLYRALNSNLGEFDISDWELTVNVVDPVYTLHNEDTSYNTGEYIILPSDYYPTSGLEITPSSLRNVRNIIEQTIGYENRNNSFKVAPLWFTSNEFRAPFLYTDPGYAKIIISDIIDLFSKNTSLLGSNISIDNIIFTRQDNDVWDNINYRKTQVISDKKTSQPHGIGFAGMSGTMLVGNTDYLENLSSINLVSSDSLHTVVDKINSGTTQVSARIGYTRYAESKPILSSNNLNYKILSIETPDGDTVEIDSSGQTVQYLVDQINANYDQTKVAAYLKHDERSYVEEHISTSTYDYDTMTVPFHKFQTGDRVRFDADLPVSGLYPGQFYYIKKISDTKIQLLHTPSPTNPIVFRPTASFMSSPFYGEYPVLGHKLYINGVLITIRSPILPATNIAEQLVADINDTISDITASIIDDKLILISKYQNTYITFREIEVNQQNTKNSHTYNSLMAYFGMTSSAATPPAANSVTPDIILKSFSLTRLATIVTRLVLETDYPDHGVTVSETGITGNKFGFDINHRLIIENKQGTNVIIQDPQLSGITYGMGIATDTVFFESESRVIINNKYEK